jgi:opacity protein-like surface antigen
MKRAAVLTLGFIFVAATCFAQSNWKPVVNLGGGVGLPTSNFKNDFKTGFNLGGGIGAEYKDMLELTGTMFYSRFPLDQTKFLNMTPNASSVSGGAAKLLDIGAQLKYFLATGQNMTRFRPYLVGRLGVAHLTQSNLTEMIDGSPVTTSFSGSTKFAYGIGAGANIELNNSLSLWVEGKFDGVNTPVNKTDFVPIQVGLRYIFGSKQQ